MRAGPPGRPKAPAAPPRPRPPAPGRAGPPRKPPPAGAPADVEPPGAPPPPPPPPPPRKPPPPPRPPGPPGPPRPPPGPPGPPRPPSPALGRPERPGAAPAAPGPGGRGGIMPGLGRGPAPLGEPVRPELGRLLAPGRGGMLPGPAGAVGVPGRWPGERDGAAPTPKGLLPTRGDRGPGFGDLGRGAAGFAPLRPPSSARGPGRCSVGGRGDDGFGVATRCSAAGRAGTAGSFVAGGRDGGSPTTGRPGPGRCSPGVGRCGMPSGETPEGAPSGAGCGLRTGLGAGPDLAMVTSAMGWLPLLPPLLTRPPAGAPLALDALPAPEGNESRNLRATGASTVEDADFTYSPRSASFLSTSLLVTPSSFASSCTRALPATALLTGGAGGNPARPRC